MFPQEFKTVFLINCGATVNVRDKCGLYGQDNVRIIIIDSHRPVRGSEGERLGSRVFYLSVAGVIG
jgi:hypothetical protein